jgi:hypothetical protein
MSAFRITPQPSTGSAATKPARCCRRPNTGTGIPIDGGDRAHTDLRGALPGCLLVAPSLFTSASLSCCLSCLMMHLLTAARPRLSLRRLASPTGTLQRAAIASAPLRRLPLFLHWTLRLYLPASAVEPAPAVLWAQGSTSSLMRHLAGFRDHDPHRVILGPRVAPSPAPRGVNVGRAQRVIPRCMPVVPPWQSGQT